jgi:hypothetical protein
MRWASAFVLATGLACGLSGAPGCSRRGSEPGAVAEAPQRAEQPKTRLPSGLRHQPRPGERVPQPELDGYCHESERSAAYYYHGGSPVVRVAREDGCAPLYITECEVEGRCYPPRDQEPGMWCCGGDDQAPAAATAKR